MKTIVWLREDLRLENNPALHSAAQQGEVIPLFVFPEDLGAASYWWLHHSLNRLAGQFKQQGVELVLRSGKVESVLTSLVEQSGADSVLWNRVYSPPGMQQGAKVRAALDRNGTRHQSFNAQLLIEPTQVLNKLGTPFKVFTPFWRHCRTRLQVSSLLATPRMIPSSQSLQTDSLDDWDLLPRNPDWSAGIAQRWTPGELGAQQRWREFLEERIFAYASGRDIPSEQNTSMLSPHLAFGEISPQQIWHDLHAAIAANQVDANNGEKFLSEIGWREFSRYLLVHFPSMLEQPFNQRFERFPWQHNEQHLRAWQKGETGYPIVDAGMRELWHTGYMHNRVRMIVASFLTKHLLTHWLEGQNWFWDTLVDADIANNTASWQWVAGCGADAAPYFRIFNPILQGEKFDPEGCYVTRWVPELAHVPLRYLNQPWRADSQTLASAGVRLGRDYPQPIVVHKTAREMALAAYQSIK